MAKKRASASAFVSIRMDDAEKTKLQAAADAEDVTLAQYVRQTLGLSVRQLGGTRPGAGRPPKESKKSSPA